MIQDYITPPSQLRFLRSLATSQTFVTRIWGYTALTSTKCDILAWIRMMAWKTKARSPLFQLFVEQRSLIIVYLALVFVMSPNFAKTLQLGALVSRFMLVVKIKRSAYRIYSDLEGERLFEARRLWNTHLFHTVVGLFCNKTIIKSKSQRCTKAQFKHEIAFETVRKIPEFS